MKNSKLLVLLLTLALAIAACGGSAEEELMEQLIESGGEGVGDVEIDTDGDDINMSFEGEDGEDVTITGSGDDEEFTITVEGEDGGTITMGGGDIPDGLKLPVPDGGEVLMAMKSPEGATVALIYPGASYDQLVGFYESQLPSDATKNELTSTEDGNTMRHTSWFGADFMVSIDDCEGPDTGEMDSACVSINEFGG